MAPEGLSEEAKELANAIESGNENGNWKKYKLFVITELHRLHGWCAETDAKLEAFVLSMSTRMAVEEEKATRSRARSRDRAILWGAVAGSVPALLLAVVALLKWITA